MSTSVPKSVPLARPDTRMPDKIGKYVVVREVGRGSTGIVYLSHDAYYGRDVAIKVYNMDTGGDEERARIARKMFLSEAHLVGMLQHPHILPIYDAGEENGHCYIVTEHVHGARTLAAYCRPDNLLRIDDTVEIMFKCAKALHYAHSRGVIHRDVKPSNIMLTQDSDVRIIDFGIALVSDSDISRIEGIAGSPSYMSPEQVQSLELTNRSDLYSLGAVMYELLTGARPFRAGNLHKLLHQIVYATAPPIHTMRKDVPEELETVVALALQKDPAKRCKSGLDFAADLTRVHQRLREANARIDRQEQFGVLRRLKFFHEFSHAEIWEVLRASSWQDYAAGEEIVKEGEMDDRFYILVTGNCVVERHSQRVGALDTGDCFGEASYVPGAKRTATIRAAAAVTVLKVSSTLLEQVSASCQLRFNRVFLSALIGRLQSAERARPPAS
ncbi:MAG: cyclic nucleotide-binding domain-containing protein [Gammaproteobacteria bacterium]|nr:MAG: cyclic nucleotide-binding domain-containing protein [Gammaproteobacteria bacterium]TLZ02938.1 MAG: cyclic nucleotide-binding domain-containing protein [Gammaproteobacteria bacterium]TLZ42288.1 MAG: cyclic nucleotide-binding domain-containing protein [Gammaproteobacteria bacterium]